MARIARVVAPGYPHHITQRGNRRQQTFFTDEYRWSSARAHLTGEDDGLVKAASLLKLVDNWRGLLSMSSPEEIDRLHRHERTGRPMGADGFVKRLGRKLGRLLRPQKPGPKKEG